jgi:hypothetical protein
VYTAPATFRMNHEYGRARVFGQWLNNEEDIETAVLSCPVDCIHWVQRDELPALEYVCQKVQQRVNVAVMMSNGGRGGDVFGERDKFLKYRRKLEEKRKAAAAKTSPMQVRPHTALVATRCRNSPCTMAMQHRACRGSRWHGIPAAAPCAGHGLDASQRHGAPVASSGT